MDKLKELLRTLEVYRHSELNSWERPYRKIEFTRKGKNQLTVIIVNDYYVLPEVEAIIKKSKKGDLLLEYCHSISGDGDIILSNINQEVKSLNRENN